MSGQASTLILPGDSPRTAYFKRKIKCPAHYMIPPGIDIYVREPVNLLKGVSEYAVKKYGVQKYRRKKDMFGRPILDWKKLYELERQGIVKQPLLSASFVIEHIYDPQSPICKLCKGRCLEGKGKINERSIKRLVG